MKQRKLTEAEVKTMIRWCSALLIVFLLSIVLIIANISPYEIKFSADTNVRDSVIATSNAIQTQNTITKQPIILDKAEFGEYCRNRNPPSVISCVVGCQAFRNQQHKNICGKGVICKLDGELDCNSYCQDEYLT